MSIARGLLNFINTAYSANKSVITQYYQQKPQRRPVRAYKFENGLMPYNFLCVQAGGMLATLRSMDDVLSFTTLIQLAAMAAVALGPSFILKKKQSFKDSFDVSSSSESKKTL